MATTKRRWGLALAAAGLVVALVVATSHDPVARRLSLLIRGNPVSADAASVARGAELFAQSCSSCHGETGRGDGPASAGLRAPPPDFAGLNRPDSVLAMAIIFGQGAEMPGWDDAFDSAEIWDLVNHLQSLQARGGERRSWRPARNS